MSLQHAAVTACIALSGQQRTYRSAEALDRALARRAAWPARPPRSGHGVVVSVQEDDGWPVVTLTPPRVHGSVLALHGGSYAFGPAPQHWTFWRRLAVAARRRVVAPLYRLAPDGTARETVPHAARIASGLPGPVALLGDSAGGGMALAAALLLREEGARPPLLLSAPWLDATLEQPWHPERDPWLAVPGMRRAAELYRGDLPIGHPFVSPLLHDLKDLGPITVATGTRDLLHRDSLRLAERSRAPVRLLVGEGLLHNPPLLPVPEAHRFLRAFVDALR